MIREPYSRPAYIFDIDGTLSDPTHRIHHVKNGNKNWTAFFDEMGDDPPMQPIVNLCQQLATVGHNILLTTGRPDNYRKITQTWLGWHGVPYVQLYMRKAGDYRPDDVVKQEILAQLLNDGWYPMMVFDDRQSVVDMWRRNGLICAQVAPGEPLTPLSYSTPKELLYVMVGPSGAGKSTYAAENFLPREIISSDNLRQDLLGDLKEQGENGKIFNVLHHLTKERLACGLRTCVDATNLKRQDRLAVVKLAPPGVSVAYIVVNRPMEQKQRDAGWRKEVPDLLERHEQRFKSQLKDILAGDNLPNVRIIDRRFPYSLKGLTDD